MENLLLFTKDNNEILENYTLLTKQELSQQEYERYIKKYPELKNQELYK